MSSDRIDLAARAFSEAARRAVREAPTEPGYTGKARIAVRALLEDLAAVCMEEIDDRATEEKL